LRIPDCGIRSIPVGIPDWSSNATQIGSDVFAIVGCTGQQDVAPHNRNGDQSSNAFEPRTVENLPRPEKIRLPSNPNHKEWPSLIDKRVEFIGRLSKAGRRKGDDRWPSIFFNETNLYVRGDFPEEAYSAVQTRFVGILTRVQQGQIDGQQGARGWVWEEYRLEVTDWSIVEPAVFSTLDECQRLAILPEMRLVEIESDAIGRFVVADCHGDEVTYRLIGLEESHATEVSRMLYNSRTEFDSVISIGGKWGTDSNKAFTELEVDTSLLDKPLFFVDESNLSGATLHRHTHKRK
jgi:hypothetical protein